MRFRKKPVVVEAYQTDKEVLIETLEGTMRADPGSWIITGVKGEQYPCDPDIFEMTYERVDDSVELGEYLSPKEVQAAIGDALKRYAGCPCTDKA